METGQQIRFKRNSRYPGEYRKGNIGVIQDVLAMRPDNQNDVYVVRRIWTEHIEPDIWVTNDDVEAFDQMRLF